MDGNLWKHRGGAQQLIMNVKERKSLWGLVSQWEKSNLSIHSLYRSVFKTASGVMWTTSAAGSSVPPVWYLKGIDVFLTKETNSSHFFDVQLTSGTFSVAHLC